MADYFSQGYSFTTTMPERSSSQDHDQAAQTPRTKLASATDYLQHYQALIRDEMRKEVREELRIEADRAARAAVDEQHALLVAKTLSAEWLRKMQSETRTEVRVGRDGQDEFHKTTYSHRKYIDQAVEIVRRCGPQDEAITESYAPVVRDNLECWESRDLRDLQDWHSRVLRSLTFLSQSAEKNSIRIYSAAVFTLRDSVEQNRSETYRCIATHPYYLSSPPETQLRIKQEMVNFFDKRFTHLVGVVTRSTVQLTGPLLRLGDNRDNIRAEDGLETGGEWNGTLHDKNRSTWSLLTSPKDGVNGDTNGV